MFTIIVKFDDATAHRVDRILDYLEAKQQAEIDHATGVLANVTEQLHQSSARLAAATSK